MGITAVTISRYLGAGAEEFGREVAEGLGFTYVDDQIITRVAERANVTPELAMQAEQRQSIVARILGALPTAIEYGDQAHGIPSRADFEDLIRDVVRDAAERGSVVLVARDAGAGKPAQDRARPPAAVLSSHLDDAGLDRRRHLVRAVAGA